MAPAPTHPVTGRRPRVRGLALAAALLVLGAAAPLQGAPGDGTAGAPPGAPLLLAVGDLRGEIKPCGCSPEGQFGGLPRRLSYLAQRFSAPGPRPVLLDLGNNFPPPSPQGDLKIRLIQDLLKHFPPQALLPGPNELALGPGRLDPGLPYMVSNDGVGQLFRPFVAVRRAGLSLGVFGYLSPGLVYQKSQHRFRLEPAGPGLLQRWRDTVAREGFGHTVLLFRGSDAELAVLQGAGLFGRIIAGNPFEDEMNQVLVRQVNGTRVFQVPTKGQGVVPLRLGGDGPPAEPRAGVDWLSGAYPDHPAAEAPFQAYEEGVKGLFFARMAEMERRRADSAFAGARTCGPCHTVQQAIWQKSRHAGALKTLEKVGKQFDPECLACHVVGLERGGFVSADMTPGMAGVQCENCHGPGKAHLAEPTAKPALLHPPGVPEGQVKPAEATCRTCHVGSHSPAFDFKVYWPKVKH